MNHSHLLIHTMVKTCASSVFMCAGRRRPKGEAFIDKWEYSYQLVQLGSVACSKAERECFARLGTFRSRDIASQAPDCDIIDLDIIVEPKMSRIDIGLIQKSSTKAR